MSDYLNGLNALCAEIHANNVAAGWWTDLCTGQTLEGVDECGRERRNVGELLILCVSELGEGIEGVLDELPDDKLPDRDMLDVELADFKIRVCDIAGAHRLDLEGAARELLAAGEPDDVSHLSPLVQIAYVVREMSKAMEGHRKKSMDPVLRHRRAFEVRLAAALIQVERLAESEGYDLAETVAEKRAFNAQRPDHKRENRLQAGGKAY